MCPGSNRVGDTSLFSYRAYLAAKCEEIDPVVVVVSVSFDGRGEIESYLVRGDIAGEALGDVLSEIEPWEAPKNWAAMQDVVRDVAIALAGKAEMVVSGVYD